MGKHPFENISNTKSRIGLIFTFSHFHICAFHIHLLLNFMLLKNLNYAATLGYC